MGLYILNAIENFQLSLNFKSFLSCHQTSKNSLIPHFVTHYLKINGLDDILDGVTDGEYFGKFIKSINF